MINPMIEVTDYHKISDTVMLLGKNMVLKFNVLLDSYSEKFGVQNMHKEFKFYYSKSGGDKYSMFRTYDYYLTIENQLTNEDVIKDSVRIGICEMTLMKMMLNQALEWFTDSKYSGLYSNKNGVLVLTGSVEPKRVTLGDRKYIELEPMVYLDYMGNSDFGIRLYLNSEINYVEMPLNRFCGLHYIIDTINLYEASLSLINYLGRPDLGTNLTSYDNKSPSIPEYQQNKTGRVVNIFSPNNKLG